MLEFYLHCTILLQNPARKKRGYSSRMCSLFGSCWRHGRNLSRSLGLRWKGGFRPFCNWFWSRWWNVITNYNNVKLHYMLNISADNKLPFNTVCSITITCFFEEFQNESVTAFVLTLLWTVFSYIRAERGCLVLAESSKWRRSLTFATLSKPTRTGYSSERPITIIGGNLGIELTVC